MHENLGVWSLMQSLGRGTHWKMSLDPNPARKAVASSQKGVEAVCEEPKGSRQCNLVPEPVVQFSQWKEGKEERNTLPA